ncbi:hypothetical protein [Picosynechococcus sp. PCC 7002]|nr:hypothetical protein [Picosynechococcus sp. PCC 7002]ACA99999.1 hypothetical protein SYNPCC7002_A2013 [Picosynechococcus sp. PCC 7002]
MLQSPSRSDRPMLVGKDSAMVLNQFNHQNFWLTVFPDPYF